MTAFIKRIEPGTTGFDCYLNTAKVGNRATECEARTYLAELVYDAERGAPLPFEPTPEPVPAKHPRKLRAPRTWRAPTEAELFGNVQPRPTYPPPISYTVAAKLDDCTTLPTPRELLRVLHDDEVARQLWHRCIDWVLYRQRQGRPVVRLNESDDVPAEIDAYFEQAAAKHRARLPLRAYADVQEYSDASTMERWERQQPAPAAVTVTYNDEIEATEYTSGEVTLHDDDANGFDCLMLFGKTLELNADRLDDLRSLWHVLNHPVIAARLGLTAPPAPAVDVSRYVSDETGLETETSYTLGRAELSIADSDHRGTLLLTTLTPPVYSTTTEIDIPDVYWNALHDATALLNSPLVQTALDHTR